jgi:hypothetical protein
VKNSPAIGGSMDPHSGSKNNNFLHSGKKQKNFQRGRALLRSRKYLDASVLSSDDDSDTTPKSSVSRSESLGVLSSEKSGEKKGVVEEGEKEVGQEVEGEKECVRAGGRGEAALLSAVAHLNLNLFDEGEGGDDVYSPSAVNDTDKDKIKNNKSSNIDNKNNNNNSNNNDNNNNINTHSSSRTDHSKLTISPLSSPNNKSKENISKEEIENNNFKNSFQTPTPKKNSKNKKNGSASKHEMPFSDFKTVSPFSDFLFTEIPRQSESPNFYTNNNNVIFPKIHTDSTLNTYYRNMEKNENINKSGTKNDRNRGRNNVTSKNLVGGVLSGGFRYVKRPNWIPALKPESPKITPHNVADNNSPQNDNNKNQINDNKNGRKNQNEIKNENILESEKVFSNFMRSKSLSPTNSQEPYIGSESVEIIPCQVYTEIVASPFRPVSSKNKNENEIFSDDCLDRMIDDKLNRSNEKEKERERERERENEKENEAEKEKELTNNENIEDDNENPIIGPYPSTPLRHCVPPSSSLSSPRMIPVTPGHPPIIPGHTQTPTHTPITPGRSPFAQSLAVGSLSPRVLKAPNSKKKNSSELGNDEKGYPLKSPLSRKPSFSSIKFSPNHGIKKRYNMNSANTEESRRLQIISSNEIITESIFNALFLIEQKNGKDSSGKPKIHRIRCWDDDTDSDDEEEEILYENRTMEMALRNFTDFLDSENNGNDENLENYENNFQNSGSGNYVQLSNEEEINMNNNSNIRLNVKSSLSEMVDDTFIRSKYKEKISAVDSSWFKNLILTNLLRPDPEKKETTIRKIRSKSKHFVSSENLILRKKSNSDLNIVDDVKSKNNSSNNNNNNKNNDNDNNTLNKTETVEIIRRNRRGSFDESISDKKIKEKISNESPSNISKKESKELLYPLTKNKIKSFDAINENKSPTKIRNKNLNKRSRSFSLTENPAPVDPPFFVPPSFSDFSGSSFSPPKIVPRTFIRKSRGESIVEEVMKMEIFPICDDVVVAENDSKKNNINTSNNNNNNNNNNINSNNNSNNNSTSSSPLTTLKRNSDLSDENSNNTLLLSSPSPSLSPSPCKDQNTAFPLYQKFHLPNSSEILSNYISASFITSLISELNYEDDRFQSPRVIVLNSLYKNCPTARSRTYIVNAVLECTYDRFERCTFASTFSHKQEFDTNLIASRGLLEIDLNTKDNCTNSNNNNENNCSNNNNNNNVINKYFNTNYKNKYLSDAINAMANSCNISASKMESTEQPPVAHKDHDSSIMDIILFVISSVFNDLLNFIHQFEPLIIRFRKRRGRDRGSASGGFKNNENYKCNINHNNNNNNGSNIIPNYTENKRSYDNTQNHTFNNIPPTHPTQLPISAHTDTHTDASFSSMMTATTSLSQNQNICFILQKALLNILRCYASPLG